MNQNLLLEELNLLCDQVDVDNIEISAPQIAKFAEIFVSNPLLSPVIENLKRDYERDHAPLNKQLKKLQPKVLRIIKATQHYIKQEAIDDPNIQSLLPWLKKDPSENAFWLHICFIPQIFMRLLSDETRSHRPFIEKYAVLDVSGPKTITLKGINTELLEQENNTLHRIAAMREWDGLGLLVRFWGIYDPRIYLQNRKAADKLHPLYALTLEIQDAGLKRSIGPTKDHVNIEQGFNPRVYLKNMQQLLIYARKILGHPTCQQQWSYDPETRVFKYGNRAVTFHKFKLNDRPSSKNKAYRSADGYPGKVLEFLTTRKNLKKEYRLATIFGDIVGDNESDDIQPIYDACKHINKQIAAKIGLQNFLEYDQNSVKINPIYLQ